MMHIVALRMSVTHWSVHPVVMMSETASSASGLLTKDSLTACVCSLNRCARLERKGGFTTNWKRDQFQPATVEHHGGVTTVRDATTVDKQRERHRPLPRVPKPGLQALSRVWFICKKKCTCVAPRTNDARLPTRSSVPCLRSFDALIMLFARRTSRNVDS